jgi:hypothetical protein
MRFVGRDCTGKPPANPEERLQRLDSRPICTGRRRVSRLSLDLRRDGRFCVQQRPENARRKALIDGSRPFQIRNFIHTLSGEEKSKTGEGSAFYYPIILIFPSFWGIISEL